MERQTEVQESYKRGADRYDDLLAIRTWWAKLGCGMVWGFEDTAYAHRMLRWLPDTFEGKLLDVPVGTALFTAEKYTHMQGARITCLDYSEDMLAIARRRFSERGLADIACVKGDVGSLPFADGHFDTVLSMNGFHAFPDKDAAFRETARVLREGGHFIGCFYIRGEKRRTDFFIRRLYVPAGYFTPPFMTKDELTQRLNAMYREAEIFTVGSIACFRCVK